MSFNVVAAVMQVLSPELVTKIAASLGIDRAAGLKAVSAAVPAILGMFAKTVSTPDAARSLTTLVRAQQPDILAKYAAIFGGPQEGALVDAGTKLLIGGIGAEPTEALSRALGLHAGLTTKLAQNLLGAISPLVAATLARYQADTGMGADGLAKLLEQQKSIFVQGAPAAFAALFGDAAVPATSATSAPSVPPANAAPDARSVRSESAGLAGGAAAALAHLPSAGGSVLGRAPNATRDTAREGSATTAGATAGSPMIAAKPVGVAAAAAIASPPNVAAVPSTVIPAIASAALEKPAAVATPAAVKPAPVTPVPAAATPPPASHAPGRAPDAAAASKPAASSPLPSAAVVAADVPPARGKPVIATVEPSRPAVGARPMTATATTEAPNPAAVARPAAVSVTTPMPPMPPPYNPPAARRALPLVAWLFPLVLLIAGGAWWLNDRTDKARVAGIAEQTRSVADAKIAAEKIALMKAETDAIAAAKAAADRAARQKAEADAAAATKLAAEAEARQAEARRQADATAAAAKATEDAERRRRADAEAASKAAAEAAASKVVTATTSADADAAAKRAADAATAEAARRAEADALAAKRAADEAAVKLAAEAELRRKIDAEAVAARQAAAAAMAEAKAKGELQICQQTVRDASNSARVQFEFASDTLRSDGVAVLTRIAAALKSCPAVRVRVEGHTDSDGDLGRNQRLSENRARSVTEFLMGTGIASDRLVAMGYGQTRPVASNDNERNRARNRRIDFVILD